MLSFESSGIRWGYSFLIGDAKISNSEKLDLLKTATKMYLSGERKIKVDMSGCEGVLYTNMEYAAFGTLTGQRFDAELDTNEGNIHLRFLIDERTFGKGSSYSDN